jgi:aspartyl protease family protein
MESARADVGLIGIVLNRAIVSIDGAPARTLKPGEEYNGVKLISTQGETAILMIDGKRRVMRIGQNAIGDSSGSPNASVTLVADARGHFRTVGSINGAPMRFLVDTGATSIALGASDAKRLRINLENAEKGMAQTANGVVQTYHARLDTVKVGDIVLHSVDCMVLPHEMSEALLGMSFLNRVNMQREGDTLILKKRF